MNSLADYIHNLDFDYMKTFSGLRGPFFDKLNRGMEKLNYKERAERRKEMDVYMEGVELFNARIINSDGQVHKSTVEIFRADRESRFTERILEILSVNYDSQSLAMCPPVFRDALVFYSANNEIKGILNICFGCDFIQDEASNDMASDDRIFPLLKKELLAIGHSIKIESGYF